MIASIMGSTKVYNKYNLTDGKPGEECTCLLILPFVIWLSCVIVLAMVTAQLFLMGFVFVFLLSFLALLLCPLPPPISFPEPLVFAVVAERATRGLIFRESLVEVDEVQLEEM